jgi:hypothetical protein
MPSVMEKQRRFMDTEFDRLRERKTNLHARLHEARRASDRRREARSSPTTLLLRRLRFGSEWL